MKRQDRNSSKEKAEDGAPTRRPWEPPRIEPLPPLEDLTLNTAGGAIPGGGSTGGSGSGVF